MILYSRQECPLCEDAEETLNSLELTYEYIDIDLNEALRKKYHASVPVIANSEGAELFWPFDEQLLIEFSVK